MHEESTDPKRDHYIAMTVLGLFALFCLFGSYSSFKSIDSDVLEKDLYPLRGTITDDAKISQGRSEYYIRFKLLLVPDLEFELSTIAYQVANTRELASEVEKNDTIEIDILRSEFEKKILKTKPLSFIDRKINPDFIDVYGFRKNKKEYLLLDDYNKAENEHAKNGIWILLAASFGWIIGMYFERRNYKKKYLS